jgi:hypothetical protein
MALINDLERLAAPATLVAGWCLVSRWGRWATRSAPSGRPGRLRRGSDLVGCVGTLRDGGALGCVKRREGGGTHARSSRPNR